MSSIISAIVFQCFYVNRNGISVLNNIAMFLAFIISIIDGFCTNRNKLGGCDKYMDLLNICTGLK